ncbi:MAG: formate dehydrogenase subunit delta [Rhizobiaceae bacterium]
MDDNDLVRMANQIADFYKPYPREEAVKGVAEHITMFWEPRMRGKLRELLESGGEGFSDIALAGATATMKS